MVTTLRIFLARSDWDGIPGISCRIPLAGIGVFGSRLHIEFYFLSKNSDLSALERKKHSTTLVYLVICLSKQRNIVRLSFISFS